MVINKVNLLVSFLTIFIITNILNNGIIPGGINYVMFFIFVVLIWNFTIKPCNLSLPHNYWIALLGLFTCIIINYKISIYSPSISYALYSSFYILQPFIIFIICYNIYLSAKNINRLLNLYLNSIVIIIIGCIFIQMFNILSGDKSTEFVGIGFASSTAVQGIVISLYLILDKRVLKPIHSTNKRYYWYIIILTIYIILTLQLKAIGGIILAVLSYKLYTQKNKLKLIISSICVIPIFIGALFLIPALSTKVNKYMTLYSLTENSQIARVALYQTAFKIVNDKFPFGTGIGTYGTPAVNLYESKVYYDYGIDSIHGISYKNTVNFRLDALWASLIGELGVIGMFFYLWLTLYPIFFYRSSIFNKYRKKTYLFFIITSTLIIIIESFTLTNLLRLHFIFIYSGISALMIRNCLTEKSYRNGGNITYKKKRYIDGISPNNHSNLSLGSTS